MTASQPSIRVRRVGAIHLLVVRYSSRREDRESLFRLLVDLCTLVTSVGLIPTVLPMAGV